MKYHAVKRTLVFFLCAVLAFSGEISLLTKATATEADSTMEQTTDWIGNSNDIPVYTIHNPIVISDGRENHQLSAEELSADTHTLLSNVVNSEYIRIARASARLLSSGTDPLPTRYSDFNGFLELVHRDDFEAVLLSYINHASDWERTILHDILSVNAVREAISSETLMTIVSTCSQDDMSLLSIVDPPEWNELDTEDAIKLQSAGYLSFVGGQVVAAYRASREYTASEQATYDSYYPANDAVLGVTRIFSADSSYNCHSYAWHLMSNSNSYWIESADMYIPNTASTVTRNNLQEKDIIVYYDRFNKILHSAVVVNVADDGVVYVQSKWGKAGVYRHRIDSVPAEYIDGNGTVIYSIYRYHGYARTTTDLGHFGSKHSYKHTDFCSICNHTIISTIVVICNGPPCVAPFSMRPLSE